MTLAPPGPPVDDRVTALKESMLAMIAKDLATPRGQFMWGLPVLALSIVIYWAFRKKIAPWPWYARMAAFLAIFGVLKTTTALASYALPGPKSE